MRITRDILINIARDTIKRLTFGGHDLVCAYLTGSLIYDQPMVGSTTDIDLIYVHSVDIPCSREIVPIAEEIHLDIAHYPQSFFSQPRKLRTDAWVGSFLCHDPILLFDTQLWFEYTRAGVSSQFFQPINTIQRVKSFSDRARSGWLELQTVQGEHTPSMLLTYLKVLKDSANAIACLTSVPLTDRRFLIDFADSAQNLQMPGLAAGFVDMIVPVEPIEPNWDAWLENWRSAYQSLAGQKNVPLALTSIRMPYYEKAIRDLHETRQEAALWILLWTWTKIAALLPPNCSENSAFNTFCTNLWLDQPHFSERLASLDTYLDTIEESIENWSAQNGL
jgi:hypothetical protein